MTAITLMPTLLPLLICCHVTCAGGAELALASAPMAPEPVPPARPLAWRNPTWEQFAELVHGPSTHLRPAEACSVFRRYSVLLDMLPLERLVGIRVGGGFAELQFDFGKDDTYTLRTPEHEYLALESGHEPAPFSVHAANKVHRRATESYKIVVRNRVRISFGRTGITGIRDGDVRAKFFCFSAAVDAREVHESPGLARDNDGRVLLKEGIVGRPLVRDGQYVAESFEDWLIVEAGGRRVATGLPAHHDELELAAR